MFSPRWFGFAIVVLCSAFSIGCNNNAAVESGPSYADLVVTYNAELEALDRLEAKRAKLVREYEVASAPQPSGDVLSNLEGLLGSAEDLQERAKLDPSADPDAMLDDLAARSEDAQELAGQLLEGLLGDQPAAPAPELTAEEVAALGQRKADFEAELAKLDTELEKQKERVERARQARDAAEEGAASSGGTS